MSNVIDFTTFKSKEDLERFARVQFEQVLKLQKEVENLQEKLKHAESLLINPPTILSVGNPEEEICRIEIKRLYDDAIKRPLEWDEIKAFDVYVKSLLAIKGKDKETEKSKKVSSNMPQEELLKLALQATDDNSEQ